MTVRRAYTTTSFGQMHYRYAGTANKPVLVLLHQTPSSSEMYELLMQALAEEYRLIAPDTPGMGLSDPVAGDMTIARLAEAMIEFLDELGIEKCDIFGHHTGASIAVEMGAAKPELIRTLALSGPTLLDDDLRAALPKAATVIPVNEDGSHLMHAWQRVRDKDPQASPDILLRETSNSLRLGDGYGEAYNAVIEQDFEAALQSLQVPVLVFAGSEDPLYPQLDSAFELLRNGRKAVIDGARTFVCETHVNEVAGLLRGFVPMEAQ